METEIDKKMFYVINTSTPTVKRGHVIVSDMLCYTESNDMVSPLIHLNYYLIPNQKQRVSFEIKAGFNKKKNFTPKNFSPDFNYNLNLFKNEGDIR